MWQAYNRWDKAKNAGHAASDDDIEKGYAIQHTAETYGFGHATGIGLGGEPDGRVPDQAWKERFNVDEPDPKQKRERSLWLPGDNVSLAVGQGDLLVTPLQLATGYATLANGGTLFTPRVARALLEPGTGLDQPQPILRELPPQPVRRTDLTPETRDAIMQGLIGVTSSPSGTARDVFRGFSVGSVAGKTGTAQHTEGGKQDDSLFVGITHPDQPRYVVLSVVEEGGFGASVAAPIARRVIDGLEGNPNPTPVRRPSHDAGERRLMATVPQTRRPLVAAVDAPWCRLEAQPLALAREVGATRAGSTAHRRNAADQRARRPDDLLRDARAPGCSGDRRALLRQATGRGGRHRSAGDGRDPRDRLPQAARLLVVRVLRHRVRAPSGAVADWLERSRGAGVVRPSRRVPVPAVRARQVRDHRGFGRLRQRAPRRDGLVAHDDDDRARRRADRARHAPTRLRVGDGARPDRHRAPCGRRCEHPALARSRGCSR